MPGVAGSYVSHHKWTAAQEPCTYLIKWSNKLKFIMYLACKSHCSDQFQSLSGVVKMASLTGRYFISVAMLPSDSSRQDDVDVIAGAEPRSPIPSPGFSCVSMMAVIHLNSDDPPRLWTLWRSQHAVIQYTDSIVKRMLTLDRQNSSPFCHWTSADVSLLRHLRVMCIARWKSLMTDVWRIQRLQTSVVMTACNTPP